MEESISRCLKGQFEIIPQTCTSNGYYTFIYLSELNFLKPILDADGWFMDLKSQISSYPPALKPSIIQTFMRRAGTWIHNFHYRSAIVRKDILFIAPIVVHTLMDIVQMIFAMNEIYFTGDKKLETSLRAMPYCPKALLEHLDFLLQYCKDSAMLEKQAAILEQIYDELQNRI